MLRMVILLMLLLLSGNSQMLGFIPDKYGLENVEEEMRATIERMKEEYANTVLEQSMPTIEAKASDISPEKVKAQLASADANPRQGINIYYLMIIICFALLLFFLPLWLLGIKKIKTKNEVS